MTSRTDGGGPMVLRVATDNIGTLEGRVAATVESMRENRIDVMAVQETRHTKHTLPATQWACSRAGISVLAGELVHDCRGTAINGVMIWSTWPIASLPLPAYLNPSRFLAAKVHRPRCR